ncbi:6-phosphogluconolactonase [Chloracidobacterium sp. D]|uniref:6-phosphogluconolactonase n=1 Tax=Chloracidobacterium sp. D TaxID=2821536 RepID=UPI001B8B8038|nr:6-phosphogluconolactonase [Chloracidobacterium sp. D]QUV80863.1 6-phosphogluconolactonase [Chloracidobacterium sp. D]
MLSSTSRRVIRVFPTAEDLARQAAISFVEQAAAAIADRGRFSVALSGGTTPRTVFRCLARPEAASQVDWSRVHFFWGDERAVPPDDPESNFRLAQEHLLQPLGIAAENIHRIEGELPPAEAAARYDAHLTAFFGAEPRRFDLIHLGMGEDGHTASLFPHTAALDDPEARVVANEVPQRQTTRITFTAALINAARAVEFFVTGAGKAGVLREVLLGAEQKHHYPSQMICPTDGTLTWFVTADAAAQLPADLLRHA